ncbi:hypothetical protein FDK62_15340 [Mycobacterium tuberculosis]|uniref:Uncharacterized protein n=2 Tax=Mycobacterium tuberculosis TaxID=1773 RepID=Q8VJ69_MYCTO|nr:hypothetical protein MT3220.2 [Mycobacterium tuberculosis CDC1551]AWY78712.1 hypothetical protein B0W95_20805 [Mycobacterium tuberculosis]ORT92081.1 hypothetical protein BS299_00105 [Mycobacterium tuberculosis M13]ORC64037.1 hypothetical protein B7740_11580 [Mycobacterium tuberculosis]ORC67998.1 hypothetical protein B7745_12110 [Mycobacterium tuberculosis]
MPHWSTSISRPAPERSPLGAARDHGGSHCRLPHAHTEVRIGLGAQSTLGACGVTRQPDRSGIRGAIVVETASASNTAGTPP